MLFESENEILMKLTKKNVVTENLDSIFVDFVKTRGKQELLLRFTIFYLNGDCL